MGADLSRVRLNPLLDYAGVELKQGGVLLDADANELVAVIDRRLRALASDTLGRATVSSTTPNAFKIAAVAGSLQIDKGRLYVDGLLAENHGAASADPAKRVFDDLLAESQFADPIGYAAQPYLPNPPALPTGGHHLVYLDVWDREVTHLEKPELVETAVGVETSSRIQTVWQVRVLGDDAGTGTTCGTPDADIPGWSSIIAPSTGVLSTGTFEVAPVDNPCELPPTGGFRGLENQLYRVEIQDAGQPGAGATFKWSRENASVGSRVTSIVSGTELQLETLGRDDVLRFNTGDWVEITDDVRELAQVSGEIRRVTVVEATRRIQFTSALPATMLPASFPDNGLPSTRHMRVRRWDQKGHVFRTDPSGTPVQVQDLDAAGSTGVIAVPAAPTTLLLEDGVTVSFASTGATGFRAGDYWVFAARTADASVEILDRAAPRGIHHHYARLGIWDVGTGTVTDCRNPWPPLTQGQDCACTACVTVQSHTSGQFTIQDAVDKVRETGGTVCLGPGQYPLREPVRLINAISVRIRGQGPATVVVSPGGAFLVQNSLAVAIENLSILSLGQQSAVTVRTVLGLALRQLVIALIGGNDARASAISLQGVVAGASISENAILAPVAVLANDPTAVPPTGEETPVAFLLTAALAIEDNLLWCQRQAVTLIGTVLHLLSTRIIGNEVLGCSDAAVSALGLGAPGSSMTISHNSIGITGTGIRCGVDGSSIEGNKLANTASAAAARGSTAVAIALATGLDKNGADQCQILANQISGFPLAGIVIGSPTRELIVKLNIIESCGNGIVSGSDANAGSVSIENNQLRNIAPSSEAGAAASVLGISVFRAETAIIADNTIRTLGVQTVQSALRAAILAFAVVRPRVSGNTITEIAPPSEFVGIAAGVMLLAPFAQFEVNHNHVERDTAPSNQASGGNWLALTTIDTDAQNPVSRVGNLATLRVDDTRVLVLGAGKPYLSTLAGAAAGVPAEPARGSVLGNVLNARGNTPAVNVSVAGECLFNDNRVEARLNQSRAVILNTQVAIVNANRVRGGEVSIEVDNAKAAAVLGNITTGVITIPGGLKPPWDALNLRV
jgi:hypothetical protein